MNKKPPSDHVQPELRVLANRGRLPFCSFLDLSSGSVRSSGMTETYRCAYLIPWPRNTTKKTLANLTCYDLLLAKACTLKLFILRFFDLSSRQELCVCQCERHSARCYRNSLTRPHPSGANDWWFCASPIKGFPSWEDPRPCCMCGAAFSCVAGLLLPWTEHTYPARRGQVSLAAPRNEQDLDFLTCQPS